MVFKNPDMRAGYREMMDAKEHFRSQEEIIRDLKAELAPVDEESFATHLSRLVMEMDSRAKNPLFENFQSPLKLITYLIDLYYSIPDRLGTEPMTDMRWQRIAALSSEVEMNYFISVGFPNSGDLFHDERDNKIEVALPTFISYFYNADLSYEEQILERLFRNCQPFDDWIKAHFGFTIQDAATLLRHIRDLTNDHYNTLIRNGAYYQLHPEEWQKLTSSFVARGLKPEEWIDQPELKNLKELMQTNPGSIQFISAEEMARVNIPDDARKRLLEFLTYDKTAASGETVYYAGKHLSTDRPLLKINDRYLLVYDKFAVEAIYNRLDYTLTKDSKIGQKYRSNKDLNLEKRVLDLFQRFLGPKAHYYPNYSIDGQSENDLLILYGNACLIVEIKDCGFRPPMRDPVKAYDKIRSDFKKAIQLGYEQCRRVEKAIYENELLTIRDGKNMKQVLYTAKTHKIQDVWSIVVTDYKYGLIQTDLHHLLQREDDSLYPWSVSADDLEILLLVMKKHLKGIAPSRFLEFLDYRERFQEHLICFDELEIDGLYLCQSQREKFKELADSEFPLNSFGGMAEIFDAYYRTGLGLPYEYDLDIKKHYPMPDYAKDFDTNVFGMDDIMGR
jgi:hypothetical protein